MHRPSFHEYHTSASKKSSKMSRSFGSDGSAPEGSTAPVETDPLMVKLDDSDDEDKEGNNQSLLQEFADEVLVSGYLEKYTKKESLLCIDIRSTLLVLFSAHTPLSRTPMIH